jgi:hypothetical protein
MGHKRSKAQKLQLLAINQTKAISQSGTNVEVGPSVEGDSRPARSLPAMKKQLEVTGKALLAVQSDLEDCRTALDNTQAELEATDTALKASESKSGDLCHALKIQKQKVRRTQASKAKLQSIIDLLQSVQLPNAREEAAKAIQLLDNTTKENASLRDELCHLLESSAAEVSGFKGKLAESRKKVHILQKRNNRASGTLVREVEKAKNRVLKEKHNFSLLQKGVYTPEARALARMLVQAGCSQEYVGEVIQKVCKSAGVEVSAKMSRRTVARAVLEGGIAAEIQLAYEIVKTSDLTLSGDGTTHKHINYESRHVNLKAPSYSEEDDNDSDVRHRSRLFGIFSAEDHTSETQVDVLINHLLQIAKRLKNSPLAQRGKLALLLEDFFAKLRGMNSDHAKDQKKVFALLKELKDQFMYETLGAEALVEMEPGDLFRLLAEVHEKEIAEAGGAEKWSQLSREAQEEINVNAMKDMVTELGKAKYAELTEEEKGELQLFIWVGCGMHKDMNAGKGGDTEMQSFWPEEEIPGPVLLANRDNAPVINDIDSDSETLKASETRALNVTNSGATKFTLLMGMYVKHKDDKKGQQDMFRYFMESVLGPGILLSYPDTSNTRYQSSGKAAGEIIVHHPYYVQFMEFIRDGKTTKKFNHLEKNLYAALHDIPTLTELCVLALYAQAITHPYMRQIRGPGTEQINMLELGPLHAQVKVHVQKIIDDPDMLLSPTCSYKTGAMDGKEWERPEVITAVHNKSQDLPYLKPLLVRYFRGALTTWERFTSEFAAQGVIDLATPAEKEKAWMPPTNDVNEGALGSYRVFIRKKPNTSMHMYNAIAMCARNGTEQFMLKNFKEDDYAYIRQQARLVESSGLEKKRRKAMMEKKIEQVEAARSKARKRAEGKAAKAAQLATVKRIRNPADVTGALTVNQLNDQLDIYRVLVEDVPLKSHMKNKQERIERLKAAIERYNEAHSDSTESEEDEEGEESGESGEDEERSA